MKKKATPWAEDIEKAIAKAYQQGFDDAIESFGKKMTECYELASKIMQRMAAYQPPKPPLSPLTREEERDYYRQTAPKRKAVTATDLEIAAVGFVLANVKPSGTPLTIKQLRGALDPSIGPKTIGAALRALIAQKSVVEGPRGKYGMAQSPSAADGATSEAPAP